MKIAILNVCVPFVYGGAELLADNLKNKLSEYGYQTTIIKIPFQWFPNQKILEHMLACRLLRLENIDKVIALKFPVYYIKHPNKVLWLLHQHRQAYDLWDMPDGIPNSPEGRRIRDTIIQADNQFIKEAKKIFTISKQVSKRLKRFNDIDSEVLYPPLPDTGKFCCSEYGDYLFYPSRINMLKRQHLAIEAMKYTKSKIKLIVAGAAATREQLEYIENIVKKNHLRKKVKIIGRWISEEDKINLFAKSLGCIFIPYDEDYGYVSLEAHHSKKTVITTHDSGAILEIVEDGLNGLVVSPEPRTIAEAMDKLYYNRALAKRMGEEGYDKLLSLNINWNNVVKKLVE
jgi:glycosyltransferase involved in cell wall biosynthesis